MIFKYAVMNGIVDNNPTQIITLPSNLPKKQRKLPTDEELKLINQNYNGIDFLPYFLLNTGLRKSEALALNYEDIDFEKKIIKVYKHLIHDGNSPIIEYKTKTINSERNVILLDRLANIIPKKNHGPLFANDKGNYLSKKEFETQWKNWQKKHNTKITAHQLRHGFATMLFEAGIDLKDAQELMGHSDIKTTHTIYTHIRNQRKEQTAAKLNAYNF
jgi:integrase